MDDGRQENIRNATGEPEMSPDGDFVGERPQADEQSSNEATLWKDKYLHLLADLENTKKRLARTSAQEVETEKEKLLRDVLPVADGLDLALLHASSDEDNRDTQPTIGFQRLLQRALYHVQSAGKDEVLGANVLVAIFSEKDSYANYLLNRYDVTRLDVVNYISHGVSKLDGDAAGEADPSVLEAEETDGPKKSSALEQFTTDLNQLAKDDRIDPLIGREKEIQRTVQVLCRRRKNNPLFVGEAGVGKTAMA